MFGAFLITFGGRFGALLESWGVSGLLLGDFGHRLASTWGPWVQLGRLGLPFWSQKSMLGAAWSPWAPILVSEIDVSLIFGRFGPPN